MPQKPRGLLPLPGEKEKREVIARPGEGNETKKENAKRLGHHYFSSQWEGISPGINEEGARTISRVLARERAMSKLQGRRPWSTESKISISEGTG